jgi:hypothetical protein
MVHPSRAQTQTQSEADKEWKWWKEELARYKNQLEAYKNIPPVRKYNSPTEKEEKMESQFAKRPYFRLF